MMMILEGSRLYLVCYLNWVFIFLSFRRNPFQNHLMEYEFFTYIMASSTGTLYTWMTNNIIRRVSEHREWKIEWFSRKYKCHKLVYYEYTKYVYNALEREKELKNWNRQKKEELIKSINPLWNDLYSALLSWIQEKGIPTGWQKEQQTSLGGLRKL